MKHKRSEIRANVVELIKEAVTGAGDRVFGQRTKPLWKTELPAILVYVRNERSTPFEVGSNILDRKLRLAIHAETEGDDLDEKLDDLASEIEDAIKANPSINNVATDAVLAQTEIDVSSEGEKPFGAVRLTYEVSYIT